jgi:hypothetical protein
MHAAHPHPDLATGHAKQRVAWLLEEAEHDRRVGRPAGHGGRGSAAA